MSYNLPVKLDKTRAVASIRVSTDKQELSPAAQREIIQRWATQNDIQIMSFHEDVCTGSTPWSERPGLTEAVNMIKRHEASWLVVAKMDRLSRDLYNQLHLQKELEKYDARVIAATEAPEALTPEKELMQNILGGFAQYEKAIIRGRIKAALAIRKKQGIKLGAVPLEATELGRCIVWAIWHLHDQGYGAERIARTLNERGITGPRGGKQHERNVQRILRRERPTVVPRAWCGLEKTFRRFADVSVNSSVRKRSEYDQRNNPDSETPRGRGRPPGRSVAELAKNASEQLSWGWADPVSDPVSDVVKGE